MGKGLLALSKLINVNVFFQVSLLALIRHYSIVSLHSLIIFISLTDGVGQRTQNEYDICKETLVYLYIKLINNVQSFLL